MWTNSGYWDKAIILGNPDISIIITRVLQEQGSGVRGTLKDVKAKAEISVDRSKSWAKEWREPLDTGKGEKMDFLLEMPEGMQPC